MIRPLALLAFPFAALILPLAGCGPSSVPDTPSVRQATPAKLRIAVAPPPVADDHWLAVRTGARRAAAELGIELTWPDAGEDQIALFNKLAAAGHQGLVVAPSAPGELAAPVRSASAQGVACLLMGDVPDREVARDYIGWITTSDETSGATAARTLEAMIGGTPPHEGHVLLLRHRENSASTRAREDAFVAELATFPQLRLIAQPYVGQEIASALSAYIRENELALAGIVISHSADSEAAILALQAIRASGVAVAATILAIDESPALLASLHDGVLDALVVRDADKMGYLAVRTLVEHLKGQKKPAYIDAGVKVKTKANTTAAQKPATPAAPPLETDAPGALPLGAR